MRCRTRSPRTATLSPQPSVASARGVPDQTSGRADAVETGTAARRADVDVRAEMGWLPRARVQRRRRAVHPEPRSEAARPLLPRARGDAAREPAGALRA